MAEYIERETAMLLPELPKEYRHYQTDNLDDAYEQGWYDALCCLEHIPASDVAPVVHGRWILEAHDERVNYRWNVTAECSECCDEQKEIWAGFFPNVPAPIARDAALISAESVKLSNYCPNCGARMDGGDDGETD